MIFFQSLVVKKVKKTNEKNSIKINSGFGYQDKKFYQLILQ